MGHILLKPSKREQQISLPIIRQNNLKGPSGPSKWKRQKLETRSSSLVEGPRFDFQYLWIGQPSYTLKIYGWLGPTLFEKPMDWRVQFYFEILKFYCWRTQSWTFKISGLEGPLCFQKSMGWIAPRWNLWSVGWTALSVVWAGKPSIHYGLDSPQVKSRNCGLESPLIVWNSVGWRVQFFQNFRF